jgi:hypothetical protein
MNVGASIEEFKCLCEFMRHYTTLRLYRPTLLLGTTGGAITGICSEAVRARPGAVLILKLGAFAVCLAFTVMDYRAGKHWHRMRDRANVLAGSLQYQEFPVSSAWSPLTSIGAGRYLHLFLLVLWLVSLFLGRS